VAAISSLHKKHLEVVVKEQVKPQRTEPDIWFLFAPLKHQKNERIIAQATELGVSKIIPVKMKHGIVDKIHRERWQLCAVEAAEQSERLSVPEVTELSPLTSVLSEWDKARKLIVADESGGGKTTNEILTHLSSPIAIIVGPEGGFAQAELALLRSYSFVQGVGLGPRILKADTAAITLLSLIANQCADCNLQPEFRSH
jgi:16S rRNA (uracil1498-N3)-methyltransferase